jgi:hypothetical protein
LRPSLKPSVIVVLPAMALLAPACASDAMQPRLLSDETQPSSEDAAPPDPPPAAPEPDPRTDRPQASAAALILGCANDEVRACTYYLPEHNGVRQCVIGYQLCSDNEWGQCLEGVTVDGGPSTQFGGSF